MNREEKLIKKYTLSPAADKRQEIIALFKEEMAIENITDHEYLKTLCILLFSIGNVTDSMLIWQAKKKDFDAGSYIDIQLLCGAGIQETKQFLKKENSSDSIAALQAIESAEIAGDFDDFNKSEHLEFYHRYYGI